MNQDTGVPSAAEISARLKKDPRLAFLPSLYRRFPDSEWFLVGGAVRDLIIGRGWVKDYDLVVRRSGIKEISQALAERGRVDLVGKNFGVLKFRPHDLPAGDAEVDIAWPRTERAGMSGGYRDFSVQSDPEMPIEKDLARRDFTMNAVAFDLRRKKFIDPFGGIQDIAVRLIRAVGQPSERFGEDFSRMLRGLRFACQLGFEIDSGTWEAIKRQAHHLDDVRPVSSPDGRVVQERVVPYETVAKELIKAIGADPARFAGLFESSGILFHLIPELVPLTSCAQPKNMHSEGDVWTHTRLALSKLGGAEFHERFGAVKPSAETALAVLLHDSGKPQTRATENGKVTFYGHPDAGAVIARAVAERLKLASVPDGGVEPERLAWLVKMHLFPNMLDIAQVKKTTLYRHFLADPVAGQELLQLAFADASGSIPETGRSNLAALDRTIAAVRELAEMPGTEAGKPPKILSGEDIMALTGVGPGPEIGRLLEAVKEAQLRGEAQTREEAAELVRKIMAGDR